MNEEFGRGSRGFGHSVVERVRTNSAMNPILWLCGCSLPFTVAGSIWAAFPVNLVFLFLVSVTILSGIGAYFVWMFKDPNRLQSEDYQLANQRMMLGDERSPGVTIIAGETMVANTNPPLIEGHR